MPVSDDDQDGGGWTLDLEQAFPPPAKNGRPYMRPAVEVWELMRQAFGFMAMQGNSLNAALGKVGLPKSKFHHLMEDVPRRIAQERAESGEIAPDQMVPIAQMLRDQLVGDYETAQQLRVAWLEDQAFNAATKPYHSPAPFLIALRVSALGREAWEEDPQKQVMAPKLLPGDDAEERTVEVHFHEPGEAQAKKEDQ